MKREQVLLKPETIKQIESEAKRQGISKSAIIRQKIEQSYNNKNQITDVIDPKVFDDVDNLIKKLEKANMLSEKLKL
jgi:hypothetical protein